VQRGLMVKFEPLFALDIWPRLLLIVKYTGNFKHNFDIDR